MKLCVFFVVCLLIGTVATVVTLCDELNAERRFSADLQVQILELQMSLEDLQNSNRLLNNAPNYYELEEYES